MAVSDRKEDIEFLRSMSDADLLELADYALAVMSIPCDFELYQVSEFRYCVELGEVHPVTGMRQMFCGSSKAEALKAAAEGGVYE
jgi:hypothetical protein